MLVRSSSAIWEGGLKGKGTMKVGAGVFEGGYSFASRFEDGKGTNPEELIGAAHAGCFSMALSLILEQAGYKPERISTKATVKVDKVGDGFKITRMRLEVRGEVPGMNQAAFAKAAEAANEGCPVSQALKGNVPFEFDARLA